MSLLFCCVGFMQSCGGVETVDRPGDFSQIVSCCKKCYTYVLYCREQSGIFKHDSDVNLTFTCDFTQLRALA